MRHEAENISGAIADAGNVFDRAIRIRFRNYATLRIGIAQDVVDELGVGAVVLVDLEAARTGVPERVE